jgi:hypothetical protein
MSTTSNGRSSRRKRGSALMPTLAAAALACGSQASLTPDAGSTTCAAGQQDCMCPSGTTGEQTCPPDGGSFGPCQCSIAPEGGSDIGVDVGGDGVAEATRDAISEGVTEEDAGCGTSDLDAAAGTLTWAENFGLSGTMYPAAVAIAPSTGAVVVTGGFTGTVNFDGGILASSPGYDAATPGYYSFVAKFDECGTYEWARAFGSPANGSYIGANAVAVDNAGRVIVAGAVQGPVSVGGAPLGNGSFVAAYDSTGAYLWSESFAAAPADGVGPVAVDSSCNVVLAGLAYHGMNLGCGTLTGYFVAELGQDGTYRWGRSFLQNTTFGSNIDATVDSSDNVILAGTFGGPTSFGGPTITPPIGATSTFVAKYDSSGNYLWAQQYAAVSEDGGAGNSEMSLGGVAVDPTGNIFVAGLYDDGALDYGSGSLSPPPSPAYQSLFLAKIGPTGTCAWAKAFAGNVGSTFLAADGMLGVTLTSGLGPPGADFGGGVLKANPGGSMAIANFDALGTYRWSTVADQPSAAGSGPNGLAGSATRIVAVGTFGPAMSTLAIEDKTLTAVSSSDLLLMSFVP